MVGAHGSELSLGHNGFGQAHGFLVGVTIARKVQVQEFITALPPAVHIQVDRLPSVQKLLLPQEYFHHCLPLCYPIVTRVLNYTRKWVDSNSKSRITTKVTIG